MLHDGGTLNDHVKYQVLAAQFILPEWAGNQILCLGISPLGSSTAAAVGDHFERLFFERTGFTIAEVINSIISDRAALSVSEEFDLGTRVLTF
jgi:hypothetical protein